MGDRIFFWTPSWGPCNALNLASNQRGAIRGPYPYPPILAALKPILGVVAASLRTGPFVCDYAKILSAALRET
jgi:hypothetical protein